MCLELRRQLGCSRSVRAAAPANDFSPTNRTSKARLNKALKANRLVAEFLLGDPEELVVADIDSYTLGSEEEARLCAHLFILPGSVILWPWSGWTRSPLVDRGSLRRIISCLTRARRTCRGGSRPVDRGSLSNPSTPSCTMGSRTRSLL